MSFIINNQLMGGKVGRELARPFQYASKAGSSETSETGRLNHGGQITGRTTALISRDKQTIQTNNFQGHLRSKGLPAEAVSQLAALQYVKRGCREQKNLTFKKGNASLDILGVAVLSHGDTMTVAIIWKRSTVTFRPPKTQVDYITRNYGFGTRNSNRSSKQIDRGLNQKELNAIMNALNQESNKYNLALEAQNSI